MNKLICIVGPTGTGKTKKAIELSRENPSILVSADSRQVYRGMDIVTGKDHPKNITIYGIDIVNPDEQCSVSVWYDAVSPHIAHAWDQGKQVIVVGGTGLYVKAITEGIDTIQVPINQSLRDALSSLSLVELQSELKESDPQKFALMNNSDANNPRRLVRAIEISTKNYKVRNFVKRRTDLKKPDTTMIGLRYYHNSNYGSNIRARVLSRLNAGAVEETRSLLSKYNSNLQSMTAIGYKSIIDHIEHRVSQDEMIEAWVKGELDYAKRQMTWFRKQPVIWYDA